MTPLRGWDSEATRPGGTTIRAQLYDSALRSLVLWASRNESLWRRYNVVRGWRSERFRKAESIRARWPSRRQVYGRERRL